MLWPLNSKAAEGEKHFKAQKIIMLSCMATVGQAALTRHSGGQLRVKPSTTHVRRPQNLLTSRPVRSPAEPNIPYIWFRVEYARRCRLATVCCLPSAARSCTQSNFSFRIAHQSPPRITAPPFREFQIPMKRQSRLLFALSRFSFFRVTVDARRLLVQNNCSNSLVRKPYPGQLSSPLLLLRLS